MYNVYRLVLVPQTGLFKLLQWMGKRRHDHGELNLVSQHSAALTVHLSSHKRTQDLDKLLHELFNSLIKVQGSCRWLRAEAWRYVYSAASVIKSKVVQGMCRPR